MTQSTPNASEGWLNSTAFEGEINTTDVSYRQSPTGTRGVTLSGLQPTQNNSFTGIQIDFPGNVVPGPIPVPQPFPDTVRVSYFRQTSSGQRTSYPAKSGMLNLTTYDQTKGCASGTFDVVAQVDGTDHSFKGDFDIRTV
ncbi:hypothetical protein IB241_25995 [Pseudomonas sp. PDM05]|jgi:hypothetical protein|uniref:hypothetical protein n=1 Tax=Pseudomonas sp. PDM05 TaxID=2769301 RepID=UPI0017834894|nr:hypothetical protein [Pseudomonas sp. PDM05]MBD9461147.1 hypothetical protein [Pseudomonas sp. PDM05]